MKIPSVNISPRVQCGKTAGKTRVSVTQLNSKLHCRDFVRMLILLVTVSLLGRRSSGSTNPGTEGPVDLALLTLHPHEAVVIEVI